MEQELLAYAVHLAAYLFASPLVVIELIGLQGEVVRHFAHGSSAKDAEVFMREVRQLGRPASISLLSDERFRHHPFAHRGWQRFVGTPLVVRARTAATLGFFKTDADLDEAERLALIDFAKLVEGVLQVALAQQEVETANARLKFLADASHLLASSLSFEEAFQRIADLAVPFLADWCMVDLAQDDGSVKRIAIAYADKRKVGIADAVVHEYPPHPKAPSGVYRVLQTGEAVFVPEVDDDFIAQAAQDERHRELLRVIGIRSLIILPLSARGHQLGALSLLTAESGRRLGKAELELARELAARGAMAIDNARLYQEARALNDALEQRVDARTKQLEEAVRELEAFSYSVSHDLRAPLRSVDGFSQALLEDYSDALPEEARDYLQRIRAGAQRMGELIDDLLTLARLSRSEMHVKQVDLSRLAHQAVATLRESDPERKVAVTIQEGLTATGDERLLALALGNLLENAWKFTARRGEAVIEVEQQPQAPHAFYVRDNGVGFDMAYAGRLFAPFQRLHTSNDFAGNGIGLATVQRIVHRHGGQIWTEAAVDKGATFYFTLPEHPVT
jgi:signal transduction histidine kinase